MSDIRINALATTATASASDDYVAIDGSANGTRKLSAYSPTFGGNLTVSGSANLTSSSSNSFIYDGTGWVWTSTGTSGGTVKGAIYTAGGELLLTANSNLATNRLLLTSAGNVTLAGNLTVSGTGNNILNSGGGNLLIGTTTDGGQKLQVSGTAAISGALSIGNTVQTAVGVASTHKVTISIGGSTYYLLATNV